MVWAGTPSTIPGSSTLALDTSRAGTSKLLWESWFFHNSIFLRKMQYLLFQTHQWFRLVGLGSLHPSAEVLGTPLTSQIFFPSLCLFYSINPKSSLEHSHTKHLMDGSRRRNIPVCFPGSSTVPLFFFPRILKPISLRKNNFHSQVLKCFPNHKCCMRRAITF